MSLHQNSIPLKILKLLNDHGSMTYREIANALGFKEKVVNLDYDKAKEEFKRGERRTPPRRFVRVVSGLSPSVYRLKRDGFIYKNEDKYSLTSKGKEYLERHHVV